MKSNLSALLMAVLFIPPICHSKTEPVDCSRPISTDNSIGFMMEGELFTHKPVTVSIVKVVNPKDWQYNEYFTGEGFSKDKEKVLRVEEKDSCTIKGIYFNYLKGKN